MCRENNVANNITSDATELNNVILLSYADYDQHFVDYASNDFHLKSSSSLINVGDDARAPLFDIEVASRPEGSHVDVGCFEYVSTTSNSDVVNNINDITLYPNPVIGAFTIRGLLGDYNLDILDVNGNVFQDLHINESVQTIILDGLPSEMFFDRIQHKTIGNLRLEKIIKL